MIKFINGITRSENERRKTFENKSGIKFDLQQKYLQNKLIQKSKKLKTFLISKYTEILKFPIEQCIIFTLDLGK